MAKVTQSLGSVVRTGLAATGAVNAGTQAIEFLSGITLARLLLPEDFGVVAIGMGFLRISFVIGNLGMGAAVVQADTIEHRDLDTAFFMSASIGLLFTAVGVLLAPAAATFFNMETLRAAMPVMSLQVLLAGVSAIPVAKMRRSLRYGQIALLEGASSLIYATVGVGMALGGWGVWSLVWAPVAAGLWTAGSAIWASGYTPRLHFKRESFHKFIRFGGGLTAKNVFYFIGRNLDYLIVARMLGGAYTGLYTRAFKLTRMPQNRLVGVLYTVCFPAFCRLRDDRERFHDWYEQISSIIAVVSTPLLLGLAAVSDDFVLAVLGSHWEGAITPIRILSFAAMINCQHTLVGAAIEATGKIRYEVATQSIYATLVVIGAVVGTRWGLAGVSCGVLVAASAMYCMKAYTVNAATGLPVRRYLRPAIAPAISGLVMYFAVTYGVAAWAEAVPRLAPVHHFLRLLAGVAIGVVTYTTTLSVLAPEAARRVFSQIGKLRGDVINRPRAGSAIEPSVEER